MKLYGVKFLLMFTVFIGSFAVAMEAPLLKTKPITNDHFKILDLPDELQAKVANFVISGKTIEEATKNIRALAHADPQFLGLINDERVTQGLIKLLQQRFNVVDWQAAIALRTAGAGRWLNKQWKSESYHFSYIYEFFIDSVSKNNVAAAQFLLENIPLVTGKETALRIAIEAKNISMVKLLLYNKANPNGYYTGQDIPFVAMFKTPLILAIEEKASSEILKLLLNAGADPNLADSGRNLPPIMWAAKLGNEQAVRLLLDAGIKNDHFFHYALVYAMADGHAQIVKLLLNAGAIPNPELKDKKTLLMLPFVADLTNNDNAQLIKMMKTLLAHGLNINAQDSNGWTALMFAVQKNNAVMVKFFLEQGANPGLQTNDEKTALDLAKEQNNSEIIELLQNLPLRKALSKKIL